MNTETETLTIVTVPEIWCPACGLKNETAVQHFPHKSLVITTCDNPRCPLHGATLGAGTVGKPESHGSISEAPVLYLWKDRDGKGVVAQYDYRTGDAL